MDEFQDHLQDAKTDSTELAGILKDYDLDAALEAELDAIFEDFSQLEINYTALLNSRRFLHNA